MCGFACRGDRHAARFAFAFSPARFQMRQKSFEVFGRSRYFCSLSSAGIKQADGSSPP